MATTRRARARAPLMPQQMKRSVRSGHRRPFLLLRYKSSNLFRCFGANDFVVILIESSIVESNSLIHIKSEESPIKKMSVLGNRFMRRESLRSKLYKMIVGKF